VLQPPSFVGSPADDEAKAEQRRARIEADMRADEERLTEQRWPFTGPRKAAKPKPVPWHAVLCTARSSQDIRCSDSETGLDERADEMAVTRGSRTGGATVGNHKGTAAATMRAQATRQALLEGKYDSREER